MNLAARRGLRSIQSFHDTVSTSAGAWGFLQNLIQFFYCFVTRPSNCKLRVESFRSIMTGRVKLRTILTVLVVRSLIPRFIIGTKHLIESKYRQT